jgi:hypothetical protein
LGRFVKFLRAQKAHVVLPEARKVLRVIVVYLVSQDRKGLKGQRVKKVIAVI